MNSTADNSFLDICSEALLSENDFIGSCKSLYLLVFSYGLNAGTFIGLSAVHGEVLRS